MSWLRALCLIMICVFFAEANRGWAANAFYVAQLPVASQSPDERAKAAAIGLKDILWRVTGSKITEQTPGLSSLFGQAETYVDSFQYTSSAPGRDGAAQHVVLQYSPLAILQLTQTYHLPYWPENRPKVLVWLVLTAEGKPPQFLKDPTDPRIQALQAAARQRGLSLAFPNFDADDLAALSPAQLMANDNEALMNASFRYSLDTLLIGVIDENGGGRWMTDHRGDKQSGNGGDLVAGLHALADGLAKRYAISGAQGGSSSATAIIAVEARSFASYYSLTAYLKKQALVASFKLLEAQPQKLILELNLRGTLEQFDKGLTLDRQLEPAHANSGDLGSLQTPVQYRWIAI